MLMPLTMEERQRIFGPLLYTLNPVPGNPENIIVLGDWIKENIMVASIPTIRGLGMFKVQFHYKAADALRFLFEEWRQLGLMPLVLSWGGTFCPRLVRGSKTSLSNHAFGTAFDINMQWNGLGKDPAALGARGSVRALVPIAEKHGFFWGGNYNNRKDGMHFEYSRGE